MNLWFSLAIHVLALNHYANAAEKRDCYECTSGPNDGCDDPARLQKWAITCPAGTQGCLKMKAPGSPLVRSCGNPPDSPVPIKDGCVNKPGVGIICSCSSGNLCNTTSTKSMIPSMMTFVLLIMTLHRVAGA